jgi:hypothetical protein
MSIVCFQYKACSIDYFLDEMKSYELSIILENLNYCLRNDWEMTREIMWASLSPFSKKSIKATDVMELPWDGKNKQPKVEVTEKLRQQMMQKAEKVKQQMCSINAF